MSSASPFLALPESEWVASNTLAFAIRDKYPVSDGHTLVVPRRLVPTWREASVDEQRALMDLVNQVKAELDRTLQPDGFNVGFNEGKAAGQTVMHLHVHVIPRYRGDMDDPRGGVRHAIPSKGNYLQQPKPLATGGVDDPFSSHLLPLLSRAETVAIVAAFIQESGLERLREDIHRALRQGASIRILTGDYLGITQADALETLIDWSAATAIPEDDEELAPATPGTLSVRVIEVSSLKHIPSFHPKSWRFEGPEFGVAFVGSSNISYAALGRGIEWNLRVDRDRDRAAYDRVCTAFEGLWQQARELTSEWVEDYAARARESPLPLPPEEFSETRELHTPHEAQNDALTRLRAARGEGRARALLVFATGLGKTLVSVLDYAQFWDESGHDHPPRLLFLAHRRELLLQAAGAYRTLLRTKKAKAATVGWFAESGKDLHATLVFASVAKLARKPHLEALASERFDYVVVDEVHHAAANSYKKILGALDPGFLLGLTATPERADGADILGLFDDHVAYRAGIDAGIRLERLVPFEYYGIRDSIDYESIPWRNRRFDPDELASAAQTEARMESLWGAWREHAGERTLLFCCSVAHADFVRGWLRQRGVDARAVHSAPSADERSQALSDLGNGAIDAVCAVDVLNEGVDVPSIDRVVMLRPTESNVVFLQQLGRGLRAQEGKDRLTVIDFVGNHKMFLQRLNALLSLGGGRPADELRRLLEGADPAGLPEGCSVTLELEAKDLLARFFRSDGADEVERVYREIASSRDERPRIGELYRMDCSPSVLRERHGSWFAFVRSEGGLDEQELAVTDQLGSFLSDLESTRMTKCFKMVTLQALIEQDALESGMALAALADHAHRILRRDPTLLADVPDDLRDGAVASGRKWQAYWKKNPIAAWTGEKKGRAWFSVDDDRFAPSWTIGPDLLPTAARLTLELVDYRLAMYRRRQARTTAGGFECKVLWNKRDPILKLPSRTRHDLPEGETDVRLPDGSPWSFRFAKQYCNVARPAGASRNLLPDLLRGWFGPSAGHPGTNYHVRFSAGPDGLSIAPSEGAQALPATRRSIAAYPSLRAAAGPARGTDAPHVAETVELPVANADAEVFAVRIVGDSMNGGRAPLRDGDWGVFRYARGAAPSAIEGRIALVQVAEEGQAYQVKRVTKDGSDWKLESDNPEVAAIPADDSMVVIARLERGLRPEDLGPGRGAVMSHDELAEAFGLGELEPRTGRWSGHLFIVVDQEGQLAAPDLAKAELARQEGETAFVLAAVDDSHLRYLGVGRLETDDLWRIPEVDAVTWKTLGTGGGVSRELPEAARLRAQHAVAAVMALPEANRIILNTKGHKARVLDVTHRGGVRIVGVDGAFKERTLSITDIAWVSVATLDVEAHGGRLDEARVNRLRYLEGTPKGSTRWIDTGWAIGIWQRAGGS